jgi:N-acetylneuraminate synthase/N,N'-diacetyllegionaminate synthase
VGGRPIGPLAPCFIAAEIGINHNGEVSLAHRLIDAAADAGVDGVKFQNYRTDDFIADRSLTHQYVSEGQTVVESQYEMFRRYELDDSAWRELRDHCQERGVVFFSTPSGIATMQRLVDLGVTLLKNGSDCLVHLPLIRAMAGTDIPTVVSTGMATLTEVEDAVDAYRDAGGTKLVLLHCTSSYPTPDEDVNLLRIPWLADRFQTPVGLSDHTDGMVGAVGAVALGACFVEKHFTLDKRLSGPDHSFSADPAEMAALVVAVRTLERQLGTAAVAPASSELVGRTAFRLSCTAARDLSAGDLLGERDVAFQRPGSGIAPRDLGSYLGRRTVADVLAGTTLVPEHFAST